MNRQTNDLLSGPPVFECLEPRWLLAAAYPTAYDQYLIELINRARANPAAEAARYGINLNEGLPYGTISTAAKQPLAVNPYLTDAAQQQTTYQFSAGVISHAGAGGSTPLSRMTASGYGFTYPSGYGESIAPLAVTTGVDIGSLQQMLFKDSTVSGRGDRVNILSGAFTEIGVGVTRNYFNGTDALIATEDFAYSAGSSFLTGVIYNDTLVTHDNFYTPGEGLGGVQITAVRRSDNAQFTTASWAAGGYSLALAAGTYDVVISGGGLATTLLAQGVTISTQNVKLDYTGAATSQWTLLGQFGGTPSAITDVDIDPTNAAHILLSTRSGIYQTTDTGAHWTLVQPGFVRELVIDPTDADIAYATLGGDSGGVLRTADGGSNWTLTFAGLPQRDMAALTLAANGTLFASDFASGNLSRSTDGGDTWSAVLDIKTFLSTTSTVYAKSLSISADAQTVYALVGIQNYDSGYLLKTTNGGTTWTRCTTPADGKATALAIDPTAPSKVYLGSQTGLYRSTNGGGAWTTITSGLPTSPFVRSIVVDPATPYRLYVSVGSRAYQTVDWGDKWTALTSAVTSRTDDVIWDLALDPGNPRLIYAAVCRLPLPATAGVEEGLYRFTRPQSAGPVFTLLAGGVAIADGQTTAINLGTFLKGAKTKAVTFTIRNDGDEPLILSSSFGTYDHITITEPASKILKAGASTTFTVTLKTSLAGTFSQALSITSNDADKTPMDFTVSGKVTQADLTGALTTSAFTQSSVPGDALSLPFVLRNSGDASASGNIAVALYISADPTFATKRLLSTTTSYLTLAGGASKSLTLKGTVPSNLAPGTYYVRAVVDSTGAVTERDETNNTADTAAPMTLVWRFGAFDGRTGVALTLPGADGSAVKFTMTGHGYGEVTGSGPAGFTLEFTGTDATSAVTITPATKHQTTLAGVTINGSLGSLTGKSVNLAGDFSVLGALGSLTLNNMTGSLIEIDSSTPSTTAAALTFARISDSSITSNLALKSITAADWVDTDSTPDLIQAAGLAGLTINGTGSTSGRFQADLWLTGSLGTVSISGAMTGSLWDVGGAAGNVTLKGAISGWNWGADAGSLVTTGTGKLTLGSIASADVVIDGTLGAVTAVRWQNGQLQAARGSTISITGVAASWNTTAVSGDFGADLTLTRAGFASNLTSLTVAGWLSGATVRSAGPVGTVTVGGIRNSLLFVGVADGVTGLPTDAAQFTVFTDGTVAPVNGLGTFTVKGISKAPASFINSTVAAWRLGTVALKGVQVDNSANGGTDFGVAGHTLATYTRDKTTIKNLTGPQIVQQATDFVVQLF
jgi:photosystem II stability/assembly factor-like uncharacterized protein